jgi:hypothetical protein
MLALIVAGALCVSVPVALLSINTLNPPAAAAEETNLPEEEPINQPEVSGENEPSETEVASEAEKVKDALIGRTSSDSMTLDELSSGRISLWKGVWSKLNLQGHNIKKDPFIVNEMKYSDAHLVPLTVGYIAGIPAGIAYLIFEIATVIMAAIFIFRRKPFGQKELFICISVFSYFIMASLEVMHLPFSSGLAYCFFVAAPMLLFRESESEREKQTSV